MSDQIELNDLPIDLNPLIKALAEMNEQSTRDTQAAALERHLVQAELNPDPTVLMDLENALVMLRAAMAEEQRVWEEGTLALRAFFTA
jgi:hypothetical protein